MPHLLPSSLLIPFHPKTDQTNKRITAALAPVDSTVAIESIELTELLKSSHCFRFWMVQNLNTAALSLVELMK